MTDLITPKAVAKPKQKSLSFKVPKTLFDELGMLKKRVQKHSHEVDFNLDAVMAESLKKQIKLANQHLDKLEKTISNNSINYSTQPVIDHQENDPYSDTMKVPVLDYDENMSAQ